MKSSFRITSKFFSWPSRGSVSGQKPNERGRLWIFCTVQRLQPTTFSKLSQSLPCSSVYYLQPRAKHSIDYPAFASSPAKWVPDAPCRPWTKRGRKTLLRQISKENTIRQSKQLKRQQASQTARNPPARHFQEPLKNHLLLMGVM